MTLALMRAATLRPNAEAEVLPLDQVPTMAARFWLQRISGCRDIQPHEMGNFKIQNQIIFFPQDIMFSVTNHI